ARRDRLPRRPRQGAEAQLEGGAGAPASGQRARCRRGRRGPHLRMVGARRPRHHAVPEERSPGHPALLHPVRCGRDRGRGERGQLDGRARRARHRPRHDRGGHLRRVLLRGGKCDLRGLPPDPARARSRRADRVLRRPRGGWPRLSLVQRLPGADVHGRCRVARARRRARHRGPDHAPGAGPAARWRRLRGRDAIGDRTGDVVQATPQTHLPHGAHPPSLRAARLAGAADHRPLLDRRHRLCPDGARHAETPMMQLPRRVLVVGFRRTGQAVARVLAERGCAVRAADAEEDAALPVAAAALPSVELPLGPQSGPQSGPKSAALLDGVDLVVPSPGVPRGAPLLVEAVRRQIPVWAEVELAARLLDCPIVAITGTNGKSTTTTLVGRALERTGRRTFTGGNLGTPLILAVATSPEVAVSEESSFQLEWVERFRPRVGCLLNLTADHLDRHADFAEYRDAKARLFAAQQASDWAVLNRDDPECAALARRCAARVVTFGVASAGDGASLDGTIAVLRLPGAA